MYIYIYIEREREIESGGFLRRSPRAAPASRIIKSYRGKILHTRISNKLNNKQIIISPSRKLEEQIQANWAGQNWQSK